MSILLKHCKKIFPFAVSIFLLTWVFNQIDRKDFFDNFIDIKISWVSAALFLFIPQILLMIFRWHILVRNQTNTLFRESCSLVLAAQTLNMFTPSKMGDIAKSFFLKKHLNVPLKTGLSIVVFEKVLDIIMIALWMLLGFFMSLPEMIMGWTGLVVGLIIIGFALVYFIFQFNDIPLFFRERASINLLIKINKLLESSRRYVSNSIMNGIAVRALILSFFLWFLHILQFAFFFEALSSSIPWVSIFCGVPIAIIIGILPISFAGIGTRDIAFLTIFSQWDSMSLLVCVGIFSHLRYLVPGILGIPVVHRYLSELSRQRNTLQTD